MTMYSSFSKGDRVRIRIALTAAWGFAVIGGTGGVFLTPATVAAELGALAYACSWVTLVFGIVSMLGVATNKYWLEWIASWFAAGGLATYGAGVWFIVLDTTPTRLQQAAYITALVSFMVYRGLACAAHARKLREIHQTVEEIQRAEENGTE